MSNNILSLFPSILVPIFFDWIHDGDLCCLDTATCNLRTRPNLLFSMSKGNISHSKMLRYHDERYEWILLRGMGLKRCSFYHWEINLRSKTLCQLFAKTKQLDFLEAPACEELILLIKDLSLRVHSLKLRTRGSNDIVESILQSLDQSVVHLDVIECSGIRSDLHPRISLLCPNLRSYIPPRYHPPLPLLCESALIDIPFHDVLRMLSTPVNIPGELSHLCTFEKTEVNSESTINVSGRGYHLKSIDIQGLMADNEAAILKKLMVNVQYLSFNRKLTRLTVLFPVDCLSTVTNLREFRAEGVSAIPFGFITLFAQCHQLRSVSLEYCPGVTDEVIIAMADNCPLLERINISDLTISEGCAKDLFVKCVHLQSVILAPPTRLNAALSHLVCDVDTLSVNSMSRGHVECSSGRAMKCLSVFSSTLFEDDEGFLAFMSLNPGLVKLTFIRVDQVNDNTIKSLVVLCPCLTSIKISQCNATSECLLDLALCAHLREFSFHYVIVKYVHAEQFFSRRTNLNKLILLGCGLTDEILDLIVRYCPTLRHLNVGYSKEISSAGVISLLERPALTYLDLENCSKVRSDILPVLDKKRSMRFLNVHQTGIESQTMTEFVEETGFSCSIGLVFAR